MVASLATIRRAAGLWAVIAVETVSVDSSPATIHPATHTHHSGLRSDVFIGARTTVPPPHPPTKSIKPGTDRLPDGANSALTSLLESEGLGRIIRNNTMGFWVGVVAGESAATKSTTRVNRLWTGAAGAALGWSNAYGTPQVAATLTDIVPAGSLTKTFTAAAVMRLVDAGELDLDEAVAPLANVLLEREANTTLEQLYPPAISNVSFRDLLSMRAGLSDYSSSAVFKATETELTTDLDPISYLTNDTLTPHKEVWRCGNATACDPPLYNSVGFLVLGLALAGAANVSTWEEYDQLRGAVPPGSVADGRYRGLTFFKHGPCSSYPNVTHYYELTRHGGYVDQINTSCLNGWAFGNVGLPAVTAATFFHDLVGPRPSIVSAESAIEMQQWGEVLAGHWWERYGLGLMWLPLERYGEAVPTTPGFEPFRFAVGHNGEDYGTYIHAAYLPSLDATVTFMMSKESGIWVNGTVIRYPEVLFCLAYRAVFRFLDQGELGDAAFRCDDRARPPLPPPPPPHSSDPPR